MQNLMTIASSSVLLDAFDYAQASTVFKYNTFIITLLVMPAFHTGYHRPNLYHVIQLSNIT